jgi:hypothetical protein
VGSGKHGDEPSGFVKGGELPDLLILKERWVSLKEWINLTVSGKQRTSYRFVSSLSIKK